VSTDTYLHLQTRRAGKVKGECVTPGHADDIAVRTWSWGVSAPTAMGSVQATVRPSLSPKEPCAMSRNWRHPSAPCSAPSGVSWEVTRVLGLVHLTLWP
jgi:hypothetical protein